MKVNSTLVNSGEAAASQIGEKLERSLPSVVKALEILAKFGIVKVEQRGARKKYRAVAKEIVITV